MFLRTHHRFKDGKDHAYWSLCETTRTQEGPRQRLLCYLGELNHRQERRWRKTIRVFNQAGEEKQLGLFPSECPVPEDDPNVVKIRLDRVQWERSRECGNVVMGFYLWRKLEMDRFWENAMDSEPGDVRWSQVAAILALNRLIAPGSELSIEEHWYPKTALDDLLGVDERKIHTDRLYRALDLMLPHKDALEKHLRQKYGELFRADFEVLLYDLTSTYFEGTANANRQAQRGYSRDHRPDAKQVLIALIVSEEGFPIAYEVFDGNRSDVTTLEEMLQTIEEKYGKIKRIWVFDRGIVSEKNLEILKQHCAQYLVGTRRAEMKRFLPEMVSGGWKKIREDVEVKLVSVDRERESYVLCRSIGRREKEKAIRERGTKHVEKQLVKLSERVVRGQIKDETKIHQRIGAILARKPHVAGLYETRIDKSHGRLQLVWQKNEAKEQWANLRDGHYLLRTNLTAKDPEELWEKYMQLTEAEACFRALKSELLIRPVWHRKESRVQAHILVAFLGYALWVTLKHMLRCSGLSLSVTKALYLASEVKSGDILLETIDNRLLRLRRVSRPSMESAQLFQALGIILPKQLSRDFECQCSADPKSSM